MTRKERKEFERRMAYSDVASRAAHRREQTLDLFAWTGIFFTVTWIIGMVAAFIVGQINATLVNQVLRLSYIHAGVIGAFMGLGFAAAFDIAERLFRKRRTP